METDHELESLVQLVLSGDVENIKIAKRIAYNSENKALKDYIQAWETLLKIRKKDVTNPIAFAAFIQDIKETFFGFIDNKIPEASVDVLIPIVKELRISSQTDADINKLLTKFIHIEHLTIDYPKEDLSMVSFEHLARLKELYIKSNEAVKVHTSISTCKELEILDLFVAKEGYLPNEIAQLSKLRHLEYIQGRELDEEERENIVYTPAVLQLEQLEYLSIGIEFFENQGANFNYLPNLTTLELDGVNACIDIDLSFLPQLKKLQKLDLDYIDIKKEYNAIFTKLTNLTSFSIYDSIISDLDLYSLRALALTNIEIKYGKHNKLSEEQLENTLRAYFPNAAIGVYYIHPPH